MASAAAYGGAPNGSQPTDSLEAPANNDGPTADKPRDPRRQCGISGHGDHIWANCPDNPHKKTHDNTPNDSTTNTGAPGRGDGGRIRKGGRGGGRGGRGGRGSSGNADPQPLERGKGIIYQEKISPTSKLPMINEAYFPIAEVLRNTPRGTKVDWKSLDKIQEPHQRRAIMLSITALRVTKLTGADVRWCYVQWHDKHADFFEEIANNEGLARAEADRITKSTQRRLDCMKLSPAKTPDIFEGKTYKLKSVLQGTSKKREDYEDIIRTWCKWYMAKHHKVYMTALRAEKPNIKALQELCNSMGAIFMSAQVYGVTCEFTPPRPHLLEPHGSEPRQENQSAEDEQPNSEQNEEDDGGGGTIEMDTNSPTEVHTEAAPFVPPSDTIQGTQYIAPSKFHGIQGDELTDMILGFSTARQVRDTLTPLLREYIMAKYPNILDKTTDYLQNERMVRPRDIQGWFNVPGKLEHQLQSFGWLPRRTIRGEGVKGPLPTQATNNKTTATDEGGDQGTPNDAGLAMASDTNQAPQKAGGPNASDGEPERHNTKVSEENNNLEQPNNNMVKGDPNIQIANLPAHEEVTATSGDSEEKELEEAEDEIATLPEDIFDVTGKPFHTPLEERDPNNLRDRSTFDFFPHGGHWGEGGHEKRLGVFQIGLSYGGDNTADEVATKWTNHVMRFVDCKRCSIGIVPKGETAIQSPLDLDDPPIGERGWAPLIHHLELANDGRSKYMVLLVQSDLDLTRMHAVLDEQYHEEVMGHQYFLRKQKITQELFLDYHRPFYTSVAYLVNSSLSDNMMSIKHQLMGRIQEVADMNFRTEWLEVAWRPHVFEGKVVHIAEVFARDAEIEDIETGILTLTPTDDKESYPAIHNLIVVSSNRWDRGEQRRIALKQQVEHMERRRHVVIDGIDNQILSRRPHKVAPEAEDDSNIKTIEQLLIASTDILLYNHRVMTSSPFLRVNTVGKATIRLQFDVKHYSIVQANLTNIQDIIEHWLDPWDTSMLQVSMLEQTPGLPQPIIASAKADARGSTTSFIAGLETMVDSVNELARNAPETEFEGMIEATTKLSTALLNTHNNTEESKDNTRNGEATNGISTGITLAEVKEACTAAITEYDNANEGMSWEEECNMRAMMEVSCRDAITFAMSGVQDSVRAIVSNTASHNRFVEQLPEKIINALRMDSPDGAIRLGEVEEAMNKLLRNGSIIHIPSVPNAMDTSHPPAAWVRKYIEDAMAAIESKIDANTEAINHTFPHTTDTLERITPPMLGDLIRRMTRSNEQVATKAGKAIDMVNEMQEEFKSDLRQASLNDDNSKRSILASMMNLCDGLKAASFSDGGASQELLNTTIAEMEKIRTEIDHEREEMFGIELKTPPEEGEATNGSTTDQPQAQKHREENTPAKTLSEAKAEKLHLSQTQAIKPAQHTPNPDLVDRGKEEDDAITLSSSSTTDKAIEEMKTTCFTEIPKPSERFYMPDGALGRTVTALLSEHASEASALKMNHIRKFEDLGPIFVGIRRMDENIDPFEYKPAPTSQTLAMCIHLAIYTDDQGKSRSPFQGISKDDRGMYCIHGLDETLMTEARPHLEQYIRHLVGDGEVEVVGPSDRNSFLSPAPESFDGENLKPKSLDGDFREDATEVAPDPPGGDISSSLESSSPPATPAQPPRMVTTPSGNTVPPIPENNSVHHTPPPMKAKSSAPNTAEMGLYDTPPAPPIRTRHSTMTSGEKPIPASDKIDRFHHKRCDEATILRRTMVSKPTPNPKVNAAAIVAPSTKKKSPKEVETSKDIASFFVQQRKAPPSKSPKSTDQDGQSKRDSDHSK